MTAETTNRGLERLISTALTGGVRDLSAAAGLPDEGDDDLRDVDGLV